MRDDRSGNGTGNRMIDDFHHALFAQNTEIFADSVENDDGLIDGVPQNRQNGSQHRQGKFPFEKSEKAKDDDDIMQIGDDRRNGIFPFETECQIDNHADDDHA